MKTSKKRKKWYSKSLREIASEIGIAYETTQHIVMEIEMLDGMRRFASPLIPKGVNFVQKQQSYEPRFEDEPKPENSSKALQN